MLTIFSSSVTYCLPKTDKNKIVNSSKKALRNNSETTDLNKVNNATKINKINIINNYDHCIDEKLLDYYDNFYNGPTYYRDDYNYNNMENNIIEYDFSSDSEFTAEYNNNSIIKALSEKFGNVESVSSFVMKEVFNYFDNYKNKFSDIKIEMVEENYKNNIKYFARIKNSKLCKLLYKTSDIKIELIKLLKDGLNISNDKIK